MKRIRSISVSQVDNGYVVQVGCKTLVFETKEKLVTEFTRYVTSPEEVEVEYSVKNNWPTEPRPRDTSEPQPQCEAQMPMPATSVGCNIAGSPVDEGLLRPRRH